MTPHDESVAAPTADPEPNHYAAHQALLTAAVRALTDVARISPPRLEGAEDGGRNDEDAAPERIDWAEFVTAALAGAAANLGGIDAALEGRPGSREADSVRNLLVGVVGHDESHPDAPAWSWDTCRTGLPTDTPETLILSGKDALRTDGPQQGAAPDRALTASIPKTPADADLYFRLLDDHDAELDAIGDLDEQLEAQRLREWADYGRALADRIRALAADTPGLDVPVHVNTEIHTLRAHLADPDAGWSSIGTRLIEEAISSTPTPADLPGGPLDRLAAAQADDVSSDEN